MKRTGLFLIALSILIIAVPSFAATKSTTFQVTANVVSNCTISVSNVAFGNYDPVVANAASGANVTATGTVTVNCTKGDTGVWVGLDNGANYNAPNRRMQIGATGNYMNYGLYQDALFGTAWGSTALTSPAAFAAFTSAATAQTLTVYGQLPKGQDATVGAYTDTVTATINY